jgi:TetR/AcrR family transcriptional regulator, transcriptional repressor for nem operon
MSTAYRGKRTGKRAAQGLRSRDKLLRAAAQRFAERGFSATSIDDVCHDTGVVKSALYWHFQSKEGLLNAVLEQAAKAFEETADGAINDVIRAVADISDPRERLSQAVARMREIVETKQAMIRLMHEILLDGAGFNKKTRAIMLRVYDRVTGALAAGIAEAIGFQPPGLESVALLILAVLNGVFVAHQLRRDPEELDKIFAELEKTIFCLVGGLMQAPSEG